MKIVIAPDSFKGSLTALEAARAVSKGIHRVEPEAECIEVPMADGGEGTVQALVDAHQGEIVRREVTGPTGERVEARFGDLGDGRAVIEMAAASGITYVDVESVDPRRTTTYGTGELIAAALDRGAEHIIVGIGGSATMDAGVGMLQALGYEFKTESGEEAGFGGGELGKIVEVKTENVDNRLFGTKIEVACDVSNPLYGPEGAARVYGPQKGATPEMVEEIDENMKKFNERIFKGEFDVDAQQVSGAGAAGGLGAGFSCVLDADMRLGAKIVAEANELKKQLGNAELVITGEGQIDSQTVHDKAPRHVTELAKKDSPGRPVICIAGSLGEGYRQNYEYGLEAIFSIIDRPDSLESIGARTEKLLADTAENVMRLAGLSRVQV